MRLNALAGNAALKRQLSAQAQGRGLSHAYLISGPAGSRKRTLARLLGRVASPSLLLTLAGKEILLSLCFVPLVFLLFRWVFDRVPKATVL